MAVGNKYIEVRREAGFKTQNDLAIYLGVSKSTIANWECGRAPFPYWLLQIYRLIETINVMKGEENGM